MKLIDQNYVYNLYFHNDKLKKERLFVKTFSHMRIILAGLKTDMGSLQDRFKFLL